MRLQQAHSAAHGLARATVCGRGRLFGRHAVYRVYRPPRRPFPEIGRIPRRDRFCVSGLSRVPLTTTCASPSTGRVVGVLRLIVVARRPSTPSSPRKCRSQAVAARGPGVRQNDIRAPGRRPPRRRPCNDAVLRQHLNDPSGQCHSDGHLGVPTRPAHRHPARLSPDRPLPRDPHLRPRALTHGRVESDVPTRGPRRPHRDRSAEPAGHPRSPRTPESVTTTDPGTRQSDHPTHI